MQNLNNTAARVLMVGPDLSLKGGIASVADGYLSEGLPEKCKAFEYLGTGVGSGVVSKSIAFARALMSYKRALPYYDIVHLHISARGSFRRKSIMARMAKRANKKVVLHEHDGEFAKSFDEGGEKYRSRVRATFALADLVIVLSEEWRDYLAHNVCDESKLEVLHNGVPIPDEPIYNPFNQAILFMGRIVPLKNPYVLLRASRRALELYPESRVLFGGDGEIEECQKLARDLGIADRCDFFGWVSGEERERLFARAGVYCLPSRNEGLPMS